ncbi:MAG: anti-sigma factor [Jatrophihabitans sp.]|nr:MAG: anti-sigma factor [Jatrophihabitans sp.]
MTTPHIAEELPRLLTGEAPRDEVLAAAAHLRACGDCQQELISAVVAHAALTGAHRFAPEVIGWSEDAPAPLATAGALPDLSAMFEQVRAEAPEPASARTGPRRRPSRLLVAATITGLLVGGGAATAGYELSSGGPGSPAGSPVALAAYGAGTHSASARLGDGQLSIDAASLPALGSDRRYEVWLTNAARTAMQPVGWIGTDGKATLTVPPDLSAQFSAIEVSVQRLDAPTYDYSGTSVLRGSYS